MAKEKTDAIATVTSDMALEAVKHFGGTQVERRSIVPKVLQWNDETIDKPQPLMFIGMKQARNKEGKEFLLSMFQRPDGSLVVTSLGVNTTALETAQRGDILIITFRGIKRLPGARMMNEFDIELVGHADSV